MRRLLRWLLNGLTLLSLVLCVATAAMWVRGRHLVDCCDLYWSGHQYRADCGAGVIVLTYTERPWGYFGDGFHDHYVRDRQGAFYEENLPRFGVGFARETNHPGRVVYLTFNDWFVLLTALVLPALSAVRHFRRIRPTPRGLCPTCSYDVTGNASGICPECGTALPAKVGA